MNKKALIKTAQKYLELEENPIFCREVEDLMNSDNIEELTDRFWRELDFGTGGLRGVIGGGNNRMNPYVVRKATRGLAQYISKNVAQGAHSVVIAYDSRHYSDLFAEEAARVLAAVDITAWLFPSLRPTPVLSYAVRKLNAAAGIMITASHNPAKYNGYKVFWSDGAQVVPPHDKGIIAEVRKVSGKIAVLSRADAEEKGLIRTVPKDLDTAYSTMVVEQCMKPQMVREHAGELSIVYSPLHGAGTVPVEQVMQNLGIHIITVPEQREPDGAFPTVEFPNPEIAPTLKMALELAKEKNADLVMATDPDADRLGIAIPDGDQWLLVSGNRLGALLTDYIFRTKKDMGLLPAQSAFINTIVTSEFQNRIADYYGATSFRVLTGFKYIGEKIRQFEEDHTYTYIFGGEESYGYLVGTSVRDKDAVSAASMTAEMALWNRSRGKSVMDHLHELWAQFGYYDEMLISRDFEGQKGQNTMDGLMESLRAQSPRKVGSIDVVRMRDFFMGTTQDVHTGKTEKDIDLPASNVIQYVLEDGSLFTVRPSGTEPKIKFYVSCRSNQGENLSAARLELSKKFADIEMWVHKLVSSQ